MAKRILFLSIFILFLASCASTSNLKLPPEIDVTDSLFDVDVYVPTGIILKPGQYYRTPSSGAITLDTRDWEQLNLDINKSKENIATIKKKISDYNKAIKTLKR